MRSLRRPALCTLASCAIGGLWWVAYTPSSLPPGAMLLAHGLGGLALERVIAVLRPGLQSAAAPGLAIAMSAGLAPAALATVQRAGLIGGKRAAVVVLAAMLLGAAAGWALGELAERGRKRAFTLGFFLSIALFGGVWRLGVLRTPQDGPPPGAVSAQVPALPVAILGVDGADWRVMEPMMAAGELPNLAALRARGQHGVLRSLEPMASPVVWTSIFTGQPPVVHGLTDWDRSDDRSRQVPTLWDIYGAAGLSSLVVNVPGSWPPHDVPEGRLISGFPLPGLSSGDKGHLMGQVIDSAGDGAVRTLRPTRDGESFEAEVQLANAAVEPRFPGFSHAVLDAALREGFIPLPGHTVRLRIDPTPTGARITGGFDGEPVELAPGAWSRWVRVQSGEWIAWIRLGLVRADSELVLFVSPPFQDPEAPKLPFTSGPVRALRPGGAPYVVEGPGWTAHRDPRVAALLTRMTLDVQATQTEALLAELATRSPTLTAWVFTATDRLQHPFWSLHEPTSYPDFSPPEALRGLDPVREAYREADAAIGRILAALPRDALVFVVSDHGADPADAHHEHGEAGHRSDGAWIAAGPLVPPSPTPTELSVLDILPTAMRCVGAPQAEDLPGRAFAALCPTASPGPAIPRWGSAQDARGGGTRVSDEQLEQIRALGYAE